MSSGEDEDSRVVYLKESDQVDAHVHVSGYWYVVMYTTFVKDICGIHMWNTYVEFICGYDMLC